MFDGERVEGPGGALRYLASHPPSAERAATLRGLARTASPPFTPVLDEAAWRALRNACRAGKP
jgi:hypothetical protein